ncbi:MAG: PAS domain S-box protein, partial [Candidatus Omnitrophica bacterium]|nr:PAS domain S-box protein [Candidatus Omnitrophota bacterium]
ANEENAVEAMKAGADGYLVKDNLLRFATSIEHEIFHAKILRKKIELERMAHLYLNIIPLIFLVLDKDGKIQAVNEAACKIMGYTQKELRGRDWFDFIPPRIKTEIKSVFHAIISGEGRRFRNYENPILTKTGSERLIKWHNVYLKDAAAKIVSVMSLGEDITEARKTEEEIRSLKARYEDLYENVHVPIFTFDLSGRFTLVNKATYHCLGYASVQELYKKSIFEMLTPESARFMRKMLEKAIAEKSDLTESQPWVVEITKPDKTKIILEMHVRLIWQGSRISEIQVIAYDITQRKLSEQKLILAEKKIREMELSLAQIENAQMIASLASSIAHEVKNPLAIILQGMDYLERSIDVTDGRASLVFKQMHQAIQKANEIIKGLLDFSVVSKLEKKIEDLNVLIERVIELLKNLFLARNIEVIKQLEPDIPTVKIDASKIEQVLINLIMNAVEAMQETGKLTIRTSTKTIEDKRWVVVEIEDTGCGLPVNAQDKIFEPFFSTHKDKGGTGLGLTIVKNLMDMHQAKIDIRNKEQGQGVRVTLMFAAESDIINTE